MPTLVVAPRLWLSAASSGWRRRKSTYRSSPLPCSTASRRAGSRSICSRSRMLSTVEVTHGVFLLLRSINICLVCKVTLSTPYSTPRTRRPSVVRATDLTHTTALGPRPQPNPRPCPRRPTANVRFAHSIAHTDTRTVSGRSRFGSRRGGQCSNELQYVPNTLHAWSLEIRLHRP
jgi:hypothetical protein